MPAIQRISDRHALADLVALDRDDLPVLIVAAEEKEAGPIVLASYLEVLKAIRRDIPFVILANAREMTIYRKDRTRSLEPIATIPTAEILSFYDPDYPQRWTSKGYLVARIDSWLRDLMRHWKSPEPPATGVLRTIGLADRLERGWLKRGVRLACLPVRGDELPDELRDWAEPGHGRYPLEATPIPSADHS
ncbi:hypothetical protein P12x_000194 [Tundrisphaera lichenicola]|uniref:hypothetical protein n=1 Tax=Tundrisphaera lichenicola TaxID=2029860 RepID=UPI003EB927A2